MNYVSYYRVSSKKQGQSGLGLEAQQRIVKDHLRNGDKIIDSFCEVETGTNKKKRILLDAAIAKCLDTGSTLLIAKLDRLARSVHLISGLKESGVDFKCCDMPDANKFTIHIMAAVAESEAEAISSRTKAGLKSIKDRINKNGFYVSKSGNKITRLGNPNPNPVIASKVGVEVNQLKSSMNRNKQVARPYAQLLRSQGYIFSDIAKLLNENGYVTSRGCQYESKGVKRLIEEKPFKTKR